VLQWFVQERRLHDGRDPGAWRAVLGKQVVHRRALQGCAVRKQVMRRLLAEWVLGVPFRRGLLQRDL